MSVGSDRVPIFMTGGFLEYMLGIITEIPIMLSKVQHKIRGRDPFKRRRWTSSPAVRGEIPARYELPSWTGAGLKLDVIEC